MTRRSWPETTQWSDPDRARSVTITIRTDIETFDDLPVFTGVLIA